MANQQYTGESIKILKGIKAVQQNPAMYIGTIDVVGFHHLVWEIIDNALDEYLAGFCDTIKVTITHDEEIIIEDNGRGIPVERNPTSGFSTIETVFTVLHASGKFDNQTYQVSGGLHGVGSTVTNALSQFLEVKVFKQQQVYTLRFQNGFKTTDEPVVSVNSDITKKHGTLVRFKPNVNFFDEPVQIDHELIKQRLEQSAYINSNLRIIFTDERRQFSQTFQFADGLKQLLTKTIGSELLVHDTPLIGEFKNNQINVRYIFQYVEQTNSQILSFCNNIATYGGGSHEQGLRMGISRVLKKTMKDYRYLNFKTDKEKLETEDTLTGLVAIIVVLHPSPKFYGQTKSKLVNRDVTSLINANVNALFEKFLLENPEQRVKIFSKILRAMRLRYEITKKTIEINRVKLFENSPLPGKLADCATTDREGSELFLVEGDSAGGSAKLGRDRQFQAILPLKGKIINSERSPLYKLFKNEEILDLIISFGYQISSAGIVCKEHGLKNCADCQIQYQEQLRYGKIIIMTDADVDGAHISVLLLTFFYRHLPWLLDDGRVFLAQPPLYKFQIGRKVTYAYTEQELTDLKTAAAEQNYTIQRYKGLGEMNPEQLWETTMDPARRILKQLAIHDGQIADATTSMLMGKEVQPRKDFIVQNANFALNLDI